MMVYLWALGVALVLWEIIVGIQARKISPLGYVYLRAHRDKEPVRFWLFFSFDALFLIVFAFLLVGELRP
ncbi:hypothetical protein [Novosphingobium sp. AAP93]|uniref:hypothetical protein n=1 Tax=Novosphingobium sp. AAP93 TaxID=1523427 RepID=UPI0012E324D8|nr:hypothetical protein [Novosphingobium sp. AAP93]